MDDGYNREGREGLWIGDGVVFFFFLRTKVLLPVCKSQRKVKIVPTRHFF